MFLLVEAVKSLKQWSGDVDVTGPARFSGQGMHDMGSEGLSAVTVALHEYHIACGREIISGCCHEKIEKEIGREVGGVRERQRGREGERGEREDGGD